MRKICLATGNANKIKEIRLLLEPDFFVCGLADLNHVAELQEDHDTLEANAIQKAEFVFNTYGIPCIADDSGLEVDALGGLPGVQSAFFAGPQKNPADNITLLMKKMEGKEQRSARFRTVLALAGFGQTRTFDGVVEGTIGVRQTGTGGFGYDPVFIPTGFSKTFAEMTPEEKNAISHRGLALKKVLTFLKEISGSDERNF